MQFQSEWADAFGDFVSWMRGHLRADLTVEALAEGACLCPRHFARRFKGAFGETPATFVEDLRLSEARNRLGNSTASIKTIASSVGFRSADAFRHAFHRRFKISPTHYRHRFARSAK